MKQEHDPAIPPLGEHHLTSSRTTAVSGNSVGPKTGDTNSEVFGMSRAAASRTRHAGQGIVWALLAIGLSACGSGNRYAKAPHSDSEDAGAEPAGEAAEPVRVADGPIQGADVYGRRADGTYTDEPIGKSDSNGEFFPTTEQRATFVGYKFDLRNARDVKSGRTFKAGEQLETLDGGDIAMRLDDPQLGHSDHGYSSTIHAAQGMTCDHVIAVLESGHGQLTDQQSFYVEISRARDSAVVLTDNIQQLTETLTANTGERLTALEAIGEAAAGREVEREMAREEPQVEQMARTNTREHDLAQDHDRTVQEEVRDMSPMAREEHEAEWRELDQADRRAAERQLGEAEQSHETEAEMTKGEPQAQSHEKTKDRDFGMEM